MVVPLGGGAGAAASNAAMFYAKEGQRISAQTRRRAGRSARHGKIKSVDGAADKQSAAGLSEGNVSDRLREEFAQNIGEQRADLTQYTTPVAMDDLDDVRSWLGYDRINLLGLSYGTRAVLVYLRQHPEHVHTATLMGVAPTYLKMPLYHSQAAARAMDLLLLGM